MANYSPRTSAQDSSVLLHHTANNAPVVNPRRPGRRPGIVTTLSTARFKRAGLDIAPSGSEGQSYSKRRKAAEQAVKQGPDAAIFEELERLYSGMVDLGTVVSNLQSRLLYRIDPKLKAMGQTRGGRP